MGTYLVLINNMKRSFRHKVFLLITLLLPLTICLLIGLIDFGKTSLRIGILYSDESQSEELEQMGLNQILDQSEGIIYTGAELRTMNTDLITGRFQILLDYRNSSDITEFQLRSNQREDKTELLNRLIKDAMLRKVPLLLAAVKQKGLTVTERSIALLFTMILILSTVHASSIILDKQSGTMLRFRYSGKGAGEYITGNFLQTLVITMLQLVLAMGTLTIFQRGFRLTMPELLLLPIVIAAFVSAISMLICLGSRSEMQSGITASSLAALLSILGGTFVSVGAMPGILRVLSYASPIRWIIGLMQILS